MSLRMLAFDVHIVIICMALNSYKLIIEGNGYLGIESLGLPELKPFWWISQEMYWHPVDTAGKTVMKMVSGPIL